MSYADIASITESASLSRRLNAAAAQEQKTSNGSPEVWVNKNRWTIASSPGWAVSWASAEAAGITDPGGNESVITDAMILAAVQPLP